MAEPGSTSSSALKRLGRNAFIYGLGMILSRAASFIMLPVYTRLLSPADYGILNLLQLTQDVLVLVLAAGLQNGVYNFFYKRKSETDQNRVITTAFLLTTVLNGLGALALLLAAPLVAEKLLGGAGNAHLVRIAAVTFALEACTSVPMILMQARQMASLYTVVSTSRLVLQLSLNILLLVVLGMGVKGILLSSLVTTVVVGTGLLIWMIRQTGLGFDRQAVRDLARFGIPYKFVAAATFILTYADRFFLKAFHGLEAVGLYSLAYQFGFMMFTLGPTPFLRAWNPQRFEMARQSAHRRDPFYNDGLRLLSVLTVTLAVGVSLYVRPVLRIMSDASFHSAATIVPVVVLAYVVQTWTFVGEFGIQISEKTKFAAYGAWISAAGILVFYALLIPPLGGFGAALATLLGFCLRFAAFYYWGQRLWPVAYSWGPSLRLLAYGVAVVLLNTIAAGDGLARELGVGTVCLAMYACLTWWGGVLTGADRRTIHSFVERALTRIGFVRPEVATE